MPFALAASRYAALFAAFLPLSVASATVPPHQLVAESGTILPPYAQVADLIVGSPAILDTRIRSAVRIKGPEAANVAPGRIRYYVEADVLALIRADGPLPTRVGYVVDVGLDSAGKVPKLNKRRVLLFARPIPGQPTMVQLTTLDSQKDWSAELDTLIRTIARDVVDPAAPPAVTGLGNAFHVPGALPGEGETQIFVQTETGAPISLSVLRRPGEQRRWSVSLGEIVDDAAGPPARDTFLWYRLACGLPARLPESSVTEIEPHEAEVARDDYGFIISQLGPCKR